MKKTLIALLAFLYITSSCEATVYVHYCMGKKVGFSLFAEPSGTCGRCGMEKSGKTMGCCKDEQKIVKSDKTQKVTDLSYAAYQPIKSVGVVYQYSDLSFQYVRCATIIHSPAHGPPGSPHIAVYLKNCTFRI